MITQSSDSATSSARFLRRPEVCKLTGLSASSLYDMMAKGTFPRNVQITKRLVVWPEAEVNAWMASRIQKRDAAEARKKGRA